MAKINLTPDELLQQSAEMLSIQADYHKVSKQTIETLKEINGLWSENIANNFESKILSAQKSLDDIEQFLGIGATLAMTSARSFENIDNLLAKEMRKENSHQTFPWLQWIIPTLPGFTLPNIFDILHNHTTVNPTTVVPPIDTPSAEQPVVSSNPHIKPFTFNDVSYKGHDYSDYEVLTNFDPTYCYNQHNYPRFNNSEGKNVGCTATADAIMASINNGQAFDPNKEGWCAQGATWTNSKSLGTKGCSQEEWLSTVYNQINAGTPVIARVSGHSVTAVGIRKGADPNNLSPADILIVDPGDGKVKALSESRKIDTGWSLRVPK